MRGSFSKRDRRTSLASPDPAKKSDRCSKQRSDTLYSRRAALILVRLFRSLAVGRLPDAKMLYWCVRIKAQRSVAEAEVPREHAAALLARSLRLLGLLGVVNDIITEAQAQIDAWKAAQ